jgi:hypothetical protein
VHAFKELDTPVWSLHDGRVGVGDCFQETVSFEFCSGCKDGSLDGWNDEELPDELVGVENGVREEIKNEIICQATHT